MSQECEFTQRQGIGEVNAHLTIVMGHVPDLPRATRRTRENSARRVLRGGSRGDLHLVSAKSFAGPAPQRVARDVVESRTHPGEPLDKGGLEVSSGRATSQFQGERRVAQHDRRLNLTGIGEEPRATGEGVHEVAVRLTDLEHAAALVVVELTTLVTGEEVMGRPLARDHLAVVEQCEVDRAHVLSEFPVERRPGVLAEPVERLAQWRTPFQVETGTFARHAPAVASPALDAVRATPRGHVVQSNFVSGRLGVEPLAQSGINVVLLLKHARRPRHPDITEAMVVSVGLAVGHEQDHTVVVLGRAQNARHRVGQVVAVGDQVAEGHAL